MTCFVDAPITSVSQLADSYVRTQLRAASPDLLEAYDAQQIAFAGEFGVVFPRAQEAGCALLGRRGVHAELYLDRLWHASRGGRLSLDFDERAFLLTTSAVVRYDGTLDSEAAAPGDKSAQMRAMHCADFGYFARLIFKAQPGGLEPLRSTPRFAALGDPATYATEAAERNATLWHRFLAHYLRAGRPASFALVFCRDDGCLRFGRAEAAAAALELDEVTADFEGRPRNYYLVFSTLDLCVAGELARSWSLAPPIATRPLELCEAALASASDRGKNLLYHGVPVPDWIAGKLAETSVELGNGDIKLPLYRGERTETGRFTSAGALVLYDSSLRASRLHCYKPEYASMISAQDAPTTQEAIDALRQAFIAHWSKAATARTAANCIVLHDTLRPMQLRPPLAVDDPRPIFAAASKRKRDDE